MKTIYLIFVEGLTDRIFYYKLLSTILNLEPKRYEVLPSSLKEFLDRFPSVKVNPRSKLSIIEGEQVLIVIMDCGGFNKIKITLRMLLKEHDKLDQLLGDGLKYIIVIGDRDKSPLESIKGLLGSMGYKFFVEGNVLRLNNKIKVLCLSQGLMYNRATDQLEDYIVYLAERKHADIALAINKFEEELRKSIGIGFDSKRLSLIYSAIIVGKEGMARFIEKLMDNINREVIDDLMEESDLIYLLNLLRR